MTEHLNQLPVLIFAGMVVGFSVVLAYFSIEDALRRPK
jgi:hypothetical protein